jgi:outer membrane protein OmpA-like peptidoglycan-associated protein
MDLKTKKILGFTLLGAVVVGGIIYFLRKKKKTISNTDSVNNILKEAFNNLEFEFGNAVIKTESYPYIDELATVLMAQPTWRLDIAGHTDNLGSDKTNMALSKARAEAVKSFLVQKGIAENRITIYYFGESKPIASNDTEEGRAKNRRVEFRIVKSDGTSLTQEDKEQVVVLEKNEQGIVVPKLVKKEQVKKQENKKQEIKKEENKKIKKEESKSNVNPNRSKAISVNGVMIYVSDDKKGRLVFESGGKIGEFKVNAKVKKFGVTLWKGSVAVAKIFKYSNGAVKIVDSTGKDFDGEDTDLAPLVAQFKQGKSNLITSIGSADLNLQKMA